MKNLIVLIISISLMINLNAQDEWSFHHKICDDLENPDDENCVTLLILETINKKEYLEVDDNVVNVEFKISKNGLFKTIELKGGVAIKKFVGNALSEIEYNYVFKSTKALENPVGKYYTIRLRYNEAKKAFEILKKNENKGRTSEEDFKEKPFREEIFRVVEVMPRFAGCEDEVRMTNAEREECAKQLMLEYMYENIRYPEILLDEEIEGMNVVQFVVDEQGNLTKIDVVRSIHPAAEAATIKLIESMPQWVAGKQRGINVKVIYTLPVRFRLDNY